MLEDGGGSDVADDTRLHGSIDVQHLECYSHS